MNDKAINLLMEVLLMLIEQTNADLLKPVGAGEDAGAYLSGGAPAFRETSGDFGSRPRSRAESCKSSRKS